MNENEENTCFYDPNFLASNILNKDNVIDYFSLSQFYDNESINEILKMQSIHAKIDIKHNLTKMIGIYYIVEEEYKEIYVIYKKENTGRENKILKIYYCMMGYIYCSPSLESISKSRMIEYMYALNESFDYYEKNKKKDKIFEESEENEEKEKILIETLYEYRENNKI